MVKGFYNLTSGMLSQNRRLDVTANNMVNLSTPGFKSERYTDSTFQEVMLSRVGNKDKSGAQEIGEQSYILAPSELYVNYAQGTPEETGMPLDFSIDGEGFFAIETPDGVAYTRDGSFSIDDEGYLCLPAHGRVLDGGGNPIQINTDSIRADARGALYTNDGDVYLGRIGVFTFADNNALVKNEDGLFGPGGQQAQEAETPLQWKWLEGSNVDMIQEMSNMMTAQRALQSASQVLKIYDGLLTKATTELGRI